MKKPLIALLLLISLGAHSQGTDNVMQFSIKEAIDFSFQHQKDVLNSQLDVEIANSQVKETIGMGLPQISASFDVKDYVKIPVSLIPAEFFGGEAGTYAAVQFGTQWNATAGLNASQLIFEPSYLVGVQAAKTFKELSVKNHDRTKLETAVSVTKAYYMVLLMRDRKNVIDANVSRLEKYNSDIKAMFENGFVEKVDMDRIQVTYNNVISEQEKFQRLIEITEGNLKLQMGLPQASTINLTDSLNAEEIKTIGISLDKASPEKRIEYALLKTQEKIQEYNVKRYKAQYLPSLVAYGNLSTTAQRTEFNIFDPAYKWYPVGIIGATLSLNLFDGLQRENKIRHEKLSLRKIKNEITYFEDAIELQVTSARSSLANAISALKIQEQNLELANSVTNTSKIKYDQGVGSNLEVLNAETSLKEAQSNYFNALYDAIIAKIDLDKSLGNFKY
jgi:outer membrane protein